MITIPLISLNGARRGSVAYDPATMVITMDGGSLNAREREGLRRTMEEPHEAIVPAKDGPLDGGTVERHLPTESAIAFRYAVALLPSQAWLRPVE